MWENLNQDSYLILKMENCLIKNHTLTWKVIPVIQELLTWQLTIAAIKLEMFFKFRLIYLSSYRGAVDELRW